MFDYSARDVRHNANSYATYEEIDERQVLALGVLLEQWETGGIKPWDVLRQVSDITGTYSGPVSSYRISLDHKPGTRHFDTVLQEFRRSIPKRLEAVSETIKSIAFYTTSRIERLEKSKAIEDIKTVASIVIEEKHELEKIKIKHPQTVFDLEQEQGFAGPPEYLQALEQLFQIRQKAVAESNYIIEAVVNTSIARVHAEKLQAEWDAANVEAALTRFTIEGHAKHQKAIDYLAQDFRLEVLGHDPAVVMDIQIIRQKVESGEFDSWDVARAIVEIVFKPDAADREIRYSSSDGMAIPTARTEFLEDIEKEKQRCLLLKKDNQKTVDALQPETEAQIKGALARIFAEVAAAKAREEAYIAKHGEKRRTSPFSDLFDFSADDDEEDVLQDDDNEPAPEFKSPLDLPAEKICKGIYIEPIGTALIEPFERTEHDDDFHSDMYGQPVARITTYRVSFEPTSKQHLNALANAVGKALEAFKEIPGKFRSASSAFGENPSGHAYIRPSAMPYVSKKDGKATPHVYLDLDDLWVIYYLLEPIIEPNAQIAAAMNMARYAEERGAVLNPDQIDYLNKGHEISTTSGALQLVLPEHVMKTAMRDAFIDYAMNKTDEAEFVARIAVIAGHTMTGGMHDPSGRFKPLALLPGETQDVRFSTLAVTNVLNTRIQDLIRIVVGESTIEGETVMDALKRTKAAVSDRLRDRARHQDKDREIALRVHFERRYMASEANPSDFNDWLAELTANALTDEEMAEASKLKEGEGMPLESTQQLVIRNSAIEIQLDGLYADGRYRTRTYGSLLMRKELPSALKPFIREEGSGVDHIRLLRAPAAEL